MRNVHEHIVARRVTEDINVITTMAKIL
jgi:hypothetical protein